MSTKTEDQLRSVAVSTVLERLKPNITRIEVCDPYIPDVVVGVWGQFQDDGDFLPLNDEFEPIVSRFFEMLVLGELKHTAQASTIDRLTEELVQAEQARQVLQTQIDRITTQRAKWRAAKQRSRKRTGNPTRYDKRQDSIYGEGHTKELTEEAEHG
jgi:uncharacterized coiled-coil protein SlyX